MASLDIVVAWFLLEGQVARDDPAVDTLWRRWLLFLRQ
jgi:hypothetical protein